VIEPGRVVEFIEENRFLTALVTRVKGNKLLVLSENDREMNISLSRVLVTDHKGLGTGQARNDLIRGLKEIGRRRADLCQRLDLVELWQLLEGEGEEFAYPYLAELAFSAPITGDQVAAVIRAVFADGVYFKLRPEKALRHEAAKVQEIVEARARDEERENRMADAAAWLARVWRHDLAGEPDDRGHVVQVLRDMVYWGSEAPEYKWGQKLVERAGLGADPNRPFQLLVRMGEMTRHENLDLVRFDVPMAFPGDVVKEAEALIRRRAWEDSSRRDLTQLEVITADSSGARDFDDAVSLEPRDDGWVLGVHIADVSSVIQPGTLLDQEALLRATSVYMPDSRIPMLPEILSEEGLSLRQDEIRPAFSLLVHLTPDAQVLDFEFLPSLVRVRRQMSYQEVDAGVATDRLLSPMYSLSQTLQARRVAAGAMILPLPKLNVYLTPEGEIGLGQTHWENPGRSMIGEFMILANHLAARFLVERNAACLYRRQDEPSQRIVPGDSDCQNLFLCLQQRKFLGRVAWGLEALPHHGMGLSFYTNLTSPLRRYIDLMIQRQVRALLNGGPPLYSPEKIGEHLILLETALRRANRIQNNRRRYWLYQYLENTGQREFEAMVLEKLPHRWRVFILDLMMDADLAVRSGQDLSPGQTITLRLKKVDAREDILKFELA
jgi:exoribonuclease-2